MPGWLRLAAVLRFLIYFPVPDSGFHAYIELLSQEVGLVAILGT
jgi:hypothetical protein